jgi:hypothetical protein
MLTRRTKLLDRTVDLRDASLCVIATEGEKTEKQYFAIFQNPKVRVKMLPTEEDHLSAPGHVLDRLDRFKQEHDLNAQQDTLWLMVDVDHHRAKELSAVCQEALQKGFQLAVSNPCFELWLLLHHIEAIAEDKDCETVEKRLRAHLGGYNKINLQIEQFRLFIAEAIRRAKALHQDSAERWPASTGTHVYKVVETLMDGIAGNAVAKGAV